MDFKGGDYMELAKAWGVDHRIKGIVDNLVYFEEYADYIHDYDLLGEYVREKTYYDNDTEGERLPGTMRADIIEFLVALKANKYANKEQKFMVDALLTCSTLDPNDDGSFIRWFILMLPRLWV